ncbi:hypothetical protein BKA66DRAFT_577074 [Pyrenochaeta sp. MPI-SDFR-AT-0127]|nr:hypothetical protein BKA66DRAFT_577074 [Pyrenochaeta sp. MPI-SDFR-AT-0127]
MNSLIETAASSVRPDEGIYVHADAAVDRVKADQPTELKIADKMGAPDVYIDSEVATCWYHWVGSIWVKPLRFENRSATYVIVLKTDLSAQLGKHRHRGEVKAYTVRGDYIIENPGTIHTLWMGKQPEVLFNVMGSIEFFNDDGTLREIMNLFSFWRMYVDHCNKHRIKPNENLWY